MAEATHTTGPPTGVRYLVLLALCAAAVIAYIHRGCIAVLAPVIQAEFRLEDYEMSLVMSAFFWSYALFQLPGGWLGDRWGSRLALTVYCATWSAATGFMGLAGGFLGLFSSSIFRGFGQAGLFPASVKSVSQWFPASQRAFPSGMLGSSMSIGAIIATALPAYLIGWLTWQEMFVSLSLVGFVWSAAFYLWFRNLPSEHSWVNVSECELIRDGKDAPCATDAVGAAHDAADGERADTGSAKDTAPQPASNPGELGLWTTLLTSPQMYCICGQQLFRAAGYVFYQTWFPTYLQKVHGVSIAKSGYLTVLPLLGVAVGSFLGGTISDWILARTNSRRLSRQGVAVAGLLGCAGFILVAYFVADPLQAASIIMLGSFCAGIASPGGYTITLDLGGRHLSTVFSTMNMVGNFGGALCPLAVTAVVNATNQNWAIVLLMFVAIYLAAAVCWICLDPERSIFPDDKAG